VTLLYTKVPQKSSSYSLIYIMTDTTTVFKNLAIIAHVDHGKTSLVDQLLTSSGTMDHLEGAELIMDSNDQEKER